MRLNRLRVHTARALHRLAYRLDPAIRGQVVTVHDAATNATSPGLVFDLRHRHN